MPNGRNRAIVQLSCIERIELRMMPNVFQIKRPECADWTCINIILNPMNLCDF